MNRIIVLAWDERLRSATYLRPISQMNDRSIIDRIPYLVKSECNMRYGFYKNPERVKILPGIFTPIFGIKSLF